jgi:hypothetical protein
MSDIKCRHCGAAFSNANALKKHVREEHPDTSRRERIWEDFR